MAVFQPPPTWASPVIQDDKTGEVQFNPVWLNWFVELTAALGPSGGGSVTSVTASSPLASSGGVAPNISVPSTTGSGATVVLQNTPTLTTPVIGAATGTTLSLSSYIRPGTDAGASQTATGIMAGNGVPNNANGQNGDFYFNAAGGALTTIYQKLAGAWVGIV